MLKITAISGITLSLLITGCASQLQQKLLKETDKGLIAYYPFSGNALDASGLGHQVTVIGATLSSDRQGQPQAAYAFNGDDFIDLNMNPGPLFSVTMWFTGSAGTLLSTHENSDNRNNFFLQLDGYDCGIAVRGIQGWWSNDMCGGSRDDFTDNRWHFIAFTSDRGNHKLYLDGELKDALLGNPLSDERSFILGRRESQGDFKSFFRGSLDEVRIYNRVLNEEEIEYLFQMDLP